MITQGHLDDLAREYYRTKDPQLKKLWLEKVRSGRMELIILNDGLYQLVPVTKQMMEHISLLVKEIDCFDLCDILRLHLTTYHESWNTHIMNDGSGHFYGCICR